MGEYPIKIGVGFEEKASRLEALIIRWLYSIFLYIVAYIWGVFAGLAFLAQWILILITGKRHNGLHDFLAGYFRFTVRFSGYILLLTDQRPPISGK